jgi:DtxR family Mn-dependent transcriptional regulator
MLSKTNRGRRDPTLGQSGEDYLEAVLVLGQEKRAVRVKDVAGHLGVSRPSVVAALAQLERLGLVRHERYGDVELTLKGRVRAEAVYRRHRLVRAFLVQVLGVSKATADRDACLIEHSLSPETVSRLVAFVHRSRK